METISIFGTTYAYSDLLEAWRRGNDRGAGFDPDFDGLALVYRSRETDKISLYTRGDEIVGVGTDGMGERPWAVTLPR